MKKLMLALLVLAGCASARKNGSPATAEDLMYSNRQQSRTVVEMYELQRQLKEMSMRFDHIESMLEGLAPRLDKIDKSLEWIDPTMPLTIPDVGRPPIRGENK